MLYIGGRWVSGCGDGRACGMYCVGHMIGTDAARHLSHWLNRCACNSIVVDVISTSTEVLKENDVNHSIHPNVSCYSPVAMGNANRDS